MTASDSVIRHCYAQGVSTLVWVGIDEIRGHFQTLNDSFPRSIGAREEPEPWKLDLSIPFNLDRYICLFVDENCVDSLLGTEELSSEAEEQHEKTSFIYAIDAEWSPNSEYGYACDDYPGWVKVAPTIVFTEFCQRRYFKPHNTQLDSLFNDANHDPRFENRDGIWRG